MIAWLRRNVLAPKCPAPNKTMQDTEKPPHPFRRSSEFMFGEPVFRSSEPPREVEPVLSRLARFCAAAASSPTSGSNFCKVCTGMGQVLRTGWSSFFSKSTATVLNTDAGAVYAAGVKLPPRDSFSRIRWASTSGFCATMYVCGSTVEFSEAREEESIPEANAEKSVVILSLQKIFK